MKIVTVRRISQIFFFTLFIWFCVVTSIGESFWQIRNWPVNWFLQLDPLVAIGTILTTHTLYWPLLWAVGTIILTIIFGRFFCSWLCPFGSIHHFTSYLAHRKKTNAQKIKLNKYRKAQSVKYIILIVFLGMAAFPSFASTLQTGLLDPIPLVTRSVNLILLPVFDSSINFISITQRLYEGAWVIFLVFLTAVLLNLVIPRFYCRFICPLGAMFGIINRFAIWRIGKSKEGSRNCKLCERSCEGGCEPASNIKTAECLLCFNCRGDCKDKLIAYQRVPSFAGETVNPDISRRGFVISIASGILIVPAVRLSAKIGSNWNNSVIRPPGALDEQRFLNRCIKCGQCMRICPTNVLQPSGIEGGIESLWTPALNNRIGSSGCQLNCVACGQICPTSAIRPITLDEKQGTGKFEKQGPIKIGTAFVDRNRCLPWAMDKPCIVCQENCPLSPKAIYTQTSFNTVRGGILTVRKKVKNIIETAENTMIADSFSTGDFYCDAGNGQMAKIIANSENTIEISTDNNFKIPQNGGEIYIKVRLQKPYIDIEKCTGCGVCEHECPVSGKRAVRISAEGETRSIDRRLLLKG